MNDDFLKQPKSPRPAFANALFGRINQPVRTRTNSYSLRQAALTAAALSLVAALALAASPTAQAALAQLVKQIGGVTFVEDEQPIASSDVPSTVTEQTLTLDEVDSLPYPISLPTWLPEGFVLDTNLTVTHFSDSYTPVQIAYWGEAPQGWSTPIYLLIGQNVVNWSVELEHVEEVQINGQAAALTRGAWNADTGEWNEAEGGLTLTWTKGDLQYQLMANDVGAETLIKVAESIP